MAPSQTLLKGASRMIPDGGDPNNKHLTQCLLNNGYNHSHPQDLRMFQMAVRGRPWNTVQKYCMEKVQRRQKSSVSCDKNTP